MNPALYSGIRTGVQIAVAWLLAHFVVVGQMLAAFGVDQTTAVEWVMTSIVAAGYAWLANWLGTRTGDDTWPRLARLAAKLMMLGVAKTPSYGGGAPSSTSDSGLR